MIAARDDAWGDAWDEYGRIWRVAMVRPKRRREIVAAAFIVLAFGGGAVVTALQHRWEWSARLLGAVVLFWLLFSWVFFMGRSLQMNSPANARLMPRQRRRLVQMALGGWLALSLGFTAMFWTWRMFPPVALYALVLGTFAASKRVADAVFRLLVLGALCTAAPLLASFPLPDALAALLASPPAVLAAGAAVLLLGARHIAAIYPDGGDRHADARARMQALLGSGHARHAAAKGKGWLSGAFYLAALKRDCRAPRPGTMLMHALGPQGHWTAWIAGVAGLTALYLATRLAAYAAHRLFGMQFGQGFLVGASTVALASMVLLAAFCNVQLGRQLRSTRGEQALLRLTPLAGAAALFNRRLAAALLKTGLVNWMMASAALLLLALLFHANGKVLVCLAALCCAAGQVAMARLLGDFSRESRPGLLESCIFLVLILAAEVLVAWAMARMGGWRLFWPGFGVLGLAGSVALAVRGWKTMLAAPSSFPAGRIG